MMASWRLAAVVLVLVPAPAGRTAPAVEGLTARQQAEFREGERLFMTEWMPAPGGHGVRDGLGPFFHAASCAACHPGAGRGLSPDATEPGRGPVFRIGTLEEAMLDAYGSQLSPLAVPGVKPEGGVKVTWAREQGYFADGAAWSLRIPAYAAEGWNFGPAAPDVQFSPRLAPALHGLGLLEAVPDEVIAGRADPGDRDGDGISGRMNLEETWDGPDPARDVPGRFGWKAWMPTLQRQVCGALGEDMGLTNVFQPHDTTPAQSDALGDYAQGGHGNVYEVSGRDHDRLTAYVRYLAPPPTPGDPVSLRGNALFSSAGCGSCHVPELKTGVIPGVGALSGRTIHPLTDLLLHDMGDGLADARPEAKASGREWRTAPLWGLGAAVNEDGTGLLLHDGRARSIEEAILWHGGEGEKSREAFLAMPAADRVAFVGFLKSL